MKITLLFVGGYVRRSDGAKVTVYRHKGTDRYEVHVNGWPTDIRVTRADAMKVVAS